MKSVKYYLAPYISSVAIPHRITDANALIIPGIPCRLFIPQVSWSFILSKSFPCANIKNDIYIISITYTLIQPNLLEVCFDDVYKKLTWSILYPNADTTPVIVPMQNAPPGPSMRSAMAPTATPPLKVAFWMSTTWNLFFLFKKYRVVIIIFLKSVVIYLNFLYWVPLKFRQKQIYLLSKSCANYECRKSRSAQWDIRIDDSAMLGVTTSQYSIEAGPINPK